MPLQFNVNRKDQFVTVTAALELNPRSEATFEAVCTLFENGHDPTVIARPALVKWEPPYVVYRLGFSGSSRLPEFQLLFEGERVVTTILGERPVELRKPTHLAGTYDGKSMRLYVDGLLVTSKEKVGELATSNQPTVFATRSSTDPGGLFVGTLQEFRIWQVARSGEDINLWKHRLLPAEPLPNGLVGLWPGEPGPPDEIYDDLIQKGFSQNEAFLLHFAYWYSGLYNKHAKSFLTDKARKYYSTSIRWLHFVKAKDGYIALYFPEHAEVIEPGMFTEPVKPPHPEGIELMVVDRHNETVTEVIQSWTDNYLKVFAPPLRKSPGELWELPADIPDASDVTISPSLRESGLSLPRLAISPGAEIADGIIKNICHRRNRAIAPFIQLPNRSFERQFTWVFADFWFGELTRDVIHLPNAAHLLFADLQTLQWLVDLGLPPQEFIDDGPDKAVVAVKKLLDDFEKLLNTPNVDEVRDIQPFLAERRHWILLSPNPKHVWPQTMLGNKYRVDFVVRESDDSYTAIEIESPAFPLYTQNLDPHQKLTHAEQQVRNYCEYVDRNRDTVEREEGLPGIFRPRGVVVIGRRRNLSEESLRKLVARNRDSGRYTIMVYDDLIDRVRALLASIEAVIHS